LFLFLCHERFYIYVFFLLLLHRKEQLALLRPKYHRSMKVDPLSTTSYRMSAKRAIQNVLKESNYAT